MEKKLGKQQLLITMFFIFLTGCIMGWIYEMGFYRINDGHFVKRGQGFGPWLPIYGVGALAIAMLLYRFVLIFSFAGLLCVYIIIPKIYELTQRTERMLLTATTFLLGVLLTIDIIVGYMIRPLTRILIQKF